MNIKSIKYSDFDIGKVVGWFAELINFDKRGIFLSIMFGLFAGILSYVFGTLLPFYVTAGIILVIGLIATAENSGMLEYAIKIVLLTMIIVHVIILRPLTNDTDEQIPVRVYTTNYKQTDPNDNSVTDKIDVRIFNRKTNELMNTITYDKSDKTIVDNLYNGVKKVKVVTTHDMFINYNQHYEYIR